MVPARGQGERGKAQEEPSKIAENGSRIRGDSMAGGLQTQCCRGRLRSQGRAARGQNYLQASFTDVVPFAEGWLSPVGLRGCRIVVGTCWANTLRGSKSSRNDGGVG